MAELSAELHRIVEINMQIAHGCSGLLPALATVVPDAYRNQHESGNQEGGCDHVG
jgi:hypothetical protein